MIASARNIPLSQSAANVPNMHETVRGWMRPLTLARMDKSVVDFEEVEVPREIRTSGVLQPFRSQDLALKPEGERQWKWYMLHCTSDVALAPDDEVVIQKIRYRVLGVLGYDPYGYLQYELVDAYSTKL